MSDQCKHCGYRGNYELCNKTPCFHHENWIDKVRIGKIKNLEKIIENLNNKLCNKCLGSAGADIISDIAGGVEIMRSIVL